MEKLQAFSSDGRLILSNEYTINKIHFQLEKRTKGLYFLNVIQNNISKTIRIVKI